LRDTMSDHRWPESRHSSLQLCIPRQGGSSGLTVGDLSLPCKPELNVSLNIPPYTSRVFAFYLKLDLEPRNPLECLETPSAGRKQAGHRMIAQ
jgi:hypothetical protein